MNMVVAMSFERGCFLLLLVGCLLGCDGFSADAENAAPEEALPEGHPLGTLTMVERKFVGNETLAIIDVKLPDDEKIRAGTGTDPWRHPSGALVYTVDCGRLINQVQMTEDGGATTVLTPCSSEIESPAILSRQFGSSQLSPDKTLLAVESFYVDRREYYFNVAIYKDKELIQFIAGNSPTWVDDDTYVVSNNGLYIVDVGGEPRSLHKDLIHAVGDVDASADGKRLVFDWNQQIWTMDIDGSNLKQVFTGPARYMHPVWSPDSEFIGFLARGNSSSQRKVHYLDLKRDKLWVSDMSPQLSSNVVAGPLSWVE